MSRYRTRKIFYDNTSGEILDIVDGDAVSINGVNDTTYEEALLRPSLMNVTPEKISLLELKYEDRREAILNAGRMKVEAGELVIYPRPTIETDKSQILSDGIDTATITSDLAETFLVDDGEEYAVNPFMFSSEVPGTYIITAKSTQNGQNSVLIEVI